MMFGILMLYQCKLHIHTYTYIGYAYGSRVRSQYLRNRNESRLLCIYYTKRTQRPRFNKLAREIAKTSCSTYSAQPSQYMLPVSIVRREAATIIYYNMHHTAHRAYVIGFADSKRIFIAYLWFLENVRLQRVFKVRLCVWHAIDPYTHLNTRCEQ